MKSLLILPFLFLSTLLYSQSRQDTTLKVQISKIENKISDIDKKITTTEIENLKDKLVYQQKMNEQTLNSVSSQLSAASYNLTLFGILFAISAVGLGFYVSSIEKKIVKIGEENKELLAKNQKIKEDVDAVNKLIQSDIHKLYLQIKREENDFILDRLVKAPKEINEVWYTLLSREQLPENFSKLRQAYLNWDRKDGNYRHNYVKIFIRHFLAQTLIDEQLRKEFSYYIGHNIFYGLENDVLKCTSDLAIVLVNEGIAEFQYEINLFFWGLSSDYKESHVVYQLLFNNLRSRKNRFDTFSLVESVKDKRPAKIAFGKLLFEQYFNDNPSEFESSVFRELDELIIDQQKDDDEAKQMQEAKNKQQEGSC